MTILSAAELLRYSRHFPLPGVGVEGQQQLKAARVLIVGAGGLGSPTALYLTAAGVGTIGLIDNDVVDASNLQRQLLYGTHDVGRSKVEAARDRLVDLNPHVEVVTYGAFLTTSNALDIVRHYDIIVDGTDNFATRYLVNDACVLLGKPNVHGSIFQFDGQVSVFATSEGPCYRCLYPEPPPPSMAPNCAEGGVLGVLPGIVGTVQAVETIKLILSLGESLVGRLWMIDALSMQTRTVNFSRDPECPACGTRSLTQLIDYDEFCSMSATALQQVTNDVLEITPAELQARLLRGDEVQLIDVREPYETLTARIHEAVSVPLATVRDSLERFDRSRDIVLLCRSGKRSAAAVRTLQSAGFTRVWSLAGGMLAWTESGGQVLAGE